MTDPSIRALSYAVRPRVVLRYLGDLSLVLGLGAAVPALVAGLTREWQLLPAYLGTAMLLACIGVGLRRLRASRELQSNEALVVVAAVFLLAPPIMSVPLMMSGLSVLDALFEAISGVTTTGLSTLASVEDKPRTFVFSRAWMQWYGGLGIAVFSLALVMGPGVAAHRLGAAVESGGLAGSARSHARRVLLVYALLTLGGLCALLVLGLGGLQAISVTLAAVSTGGFAPWDASLGALPRRLQVATVAISFCGALSLPLFARAWRNGAKELARDVELRALVVLGGAISLGLAALPIGAGGDAASATLSDAFLLGFSAQTTTGFATLAPAELPSSAKLLTILAMASGGSIGSTAGGIKLLRLLVVWQVLRFTLARTRLPRGAVSEPRLGGEPLGPEEVQGALLVALLFPVVILLSWLPFVVLGYNPLDALFEVVSAVGTVGLSTGIVRPELEPVLKGVLCLDMWLGRLEVVALLILFAPRTWIGRHRSGT